MGPVPDQSHHLGDQHAASNRVGFAREKIAVRGKLRLGWWEGSARTRFATERWKENGKIQIFCLWQTYNEQTDTSILTHGEEQQMVKQMTQKRMSYFFK